MTKVEAIVSVLKEKGGAASWAYIYDHIDRFYPNIKSSNTWKAGIRGVLFRELYQDRHFKRVDIGVYALRTYDDIETLEGTKKKSIDKEKILKTARGFVTTTPSHKIVKAKQKKRIENRTQKERVAILEDYSCQVCGWSIEWKNSNGEKQYSIEIDHIIPKEDGGGEELSNLWALCPNCHKKKTLGLITVDLADKKVLEKGKIITLHHNYHLWL